MPSCDYKKLKTQLKVCQNRMNVIEKKKHELNMKARHDVANLMKNGKIESARIRTEHIIREDYVIEALEILQTHIYLILSRFSLFECSKNVDEGLEESIATLIWCSARLSRDVEELQVIRDCFQAKYTKEYVRACSANELKKVNPKVVGRLDTAPPPKPLVEKYMVAIAKTYNVEYEPQGLLDGSNGGNADRANSELTESRLINFEPENADGIPPSEAPWETQVKLPPGVPYPEYDPFPQPDIPVPLIPSQPPVDSAAKMDPNPPAPPPYDNIMFPEKQVPSVSASAPPPPIPDVPPVVAPDDEPPKYIPQDDDDDGSSSSDQDDFDDLQRRFRELTKKD